jgi:flagellar hook-associated protein 2
VPITATGLATGLDVESLVTQLVGAEVAAPSSRLDVKEARYQAKISAFGSLKGALANFQTSLASVSSLSSFQEKAASSNLSQKVSITATEAAANNAYNVEIANIAVAQTLASAGGIFTSTDAAVGLGTLSVNDGSQTASITIDASNNSLSGLRDAINASDANVNASIINDGAGYRLVLQATKTGLANAITVSATSDSDGNLTDANNLSRFVSSNLTETIAAADAAFSINGLDITSSLNTVDNAIEGVTLTLKAATDVGEVALVSINDNTAGIVGAINTFKDGYNDLIKAINDLTSYNADLGRGSVLTGDPGIRSLGQKLRTMLNTQVENVSSNVGSLAELGITTDVKDGTLSINTTTLNGFIASDPLDVASIFASLARPTNESVEFVSSGPKTLVGDYAVDFTAASAGSITSGVVSVNGQSLDFSGQNKDVQFTVTVDGVTSSTITLNGDYTTGASDAENLGLLATALQTQINSALPSNTVLVTADTGANKLVVSTVSEGASSSVTFAEVVRLDSIGFAAGTTAVSGSAASGTINGQAATWDATARTLTGATSSSVEGLVLKIDSGATGDLGSVAYSKGLMTDIDSLVTELLSASGPLESRIKGLADSVSDIAEQREALQRRVSSLESRYRQQFNGLETLISQLNTTQNFLTTALSQFVDPLSFKK